MELLRHPIVVAIAMSGLTFAILSHINYLPKNNNIDRERKKGLLNDPKEINVLITFTIGLLSWYFTYLFNTPENNEISFGKINDINYTNSDDMLSYNVLENGIKIPNKDLPPVMIEYV